ncbi:Saccharopine dehydrogenase-like oxidoreductase [Eumeta japonica]|uniref:Saccharopine dehydrogenase-like oxidoreductase n=1 Tax=Eumeta variegata TaxID=151549 RepID=A0A4C1WMH2_EUMVA|nr:Saccharopine dehydrogenase-like oxidoreductase [Eumeta japonica]
MYREEKFMPRVKSARSFAREALLIALTADSDHGRAVDFASGPTSTVNSSPLDSRLDVVIFGATGFTGKHAAEEAARLARAAPLAWAVAGRSRAKLEALVGELSTKMGGTLLVNASVSPREDLPRPKSDKDLSSVKVIVADVNDEQSLKQMTSQAKVIANCCGPFRLYGERVVRACIDTKTHYVDVSGEPQVFSYVLRTNMLILLYFFQNGIDFITRPERVPTPALTAVSGLHLCWANAKFMETMQLVHDAAARDAGVYVVSACGFDSVPNDMGVVFLQQNFGGILNSVESYLSFRLPVLDKNSQGRGVLNYGTWESLVHSLAHASEIPMLRNKLYPEQLPTFRPKLEKRGILHKRDEKWWLPFLGADKSIVYRTQRHFYDLEKKRPVQFTTYVNLGTLFNSVLAIIAAGVLYVMALTSPTRKILLDYPNIFSFGLITRNEPKEELIANTAYTIELHGTGWDHGVTDVESTPPKKKVIVKVSGMDPGYGTTVTALMFCALAIIRESDSMPPGLGEVFTSFRMLSSHQRKRRLATTPQALDERRRLSSKLLNLKQEEFNAYEFVHLPRRPPPPFVIQGLERVGAPVTSGAGTPRRPAAFSGAVTALGPTA